MMVVQPIDVPDDAGILMVSTKLLIRTGRNFHSIRMSLMVASTPHCEACPTASRSRQYAAGMRWVIYRGVTAETLSC